MIAAWCLMLACCLLLDAWTLARPIQKGFHTAPLFWRRPQAAPFLDGSGRFSSSKKAASIMQQALRNWFLRLARNEEILFDHSVRFFWEDFFSGNHIIILLSTPFKRGSSSGQVEESDHGCMLNRESKSSNGYIWLGNNCMLNRESISSNGCIWLGND